MTHQREPKPERVFEWQIHKFGVLADAPTYDPSKHVKVAELLSFMTVPQREAVMLRMELLSYAKIAEYLGISVSAVEKRIEFGMKNVKRYAQDIELFENGWEDGTQSPSNPPPYRKSRRVHETIIDPMFWIDAWEDGTKLPPLLVNTKTPKPTKNGKPQSTRYTGQQRNELMQKALEYEALGLSQRRIAGLLKVSVNLVKELLIKAHHSGLTAKSRELK